MKLFPSFAFGEIHPTHLLGSHMFYEYIQTNTEFQMKKPYKILLIIGIVLVSLVAFSIVCVMMLPWILIYSHIHSMPDPPAPEITYGEFPFELVYTIDGETVTVNDVFICEYDGIDANEGVGKYRTWNGYIQGTGKTSVVLYEDTEIVITFSVGSPKYYMDDLQDSEQIPLTPRVHARAKRLQYVGTVYDEDEILKQYKIEIVSWKFSDPIKNTYK